MSRPKAAWGVYRSLYACYADHFGVSRGKAPSRKGPKPYSRRGNPAANMGFDGLTTCRCGQVIRLICKAGEVSLAVLSVAVILYFVACWFCWVRANDQRVDSYLDRETAYRNAQ